MSIKWENLGFTPDGPTLEKLVSSCCCCAIKNRNILSNLNGSINSGELIALMGPSGAGKSTLLNCITKGQKVQGFHGILKASTSLQPIRASFINQDEKEHLLMSLTVSQSLRYASRLKNPPSTPKEVHEQNVQCLIHELELDGSENTTVERCSGGQKKRLAIAMELTALDKPQFLFLDEPTSGLDSYVGLKVVELLTKLASTHNMAIISTIHQPSFKLFSLFSRAYIISGIGDFIYNGAPGDLLNHLKQCGYNCGTRNNNENPADIAIELASAINRDSVMARNYAENNDYRYRVNSDEEQIRMTVDEIEPVEAYISEDENVAICARMVHAVNQSQEQPNRNSITHTEDYVEIQEQGLCKNGTGFSFHNLWVLFLRSAHTSIWKQKRFILIRLALHLIVALVLAALYSPEIGLQDGCIHNTTIVDKNCSSSVGAISTTSELKKESTTSKNVKFQFFSLLFLMFAALMPTVLTFPADIKLFLNEHRNGWYSSSSYYISKTVTEIPLQLLFPFFYTYFLYAYSQQPGMDHWYGGIIGCMSERYSQFLLVTTISCFIAQGLGFLIGILCVRSFNISIIVSSSVLLFLFLFSGFFVKRVEMAASVSWITSFSFIRYAFESLLIIIYGKGRCTDPMIPSILHLFKLTDSDVKSNIWFLVTHLIVIRVLAFLVLKYMADPGSILICTTNGKVLNGMISLLVSIRTKLRPIWKKTGGYIVKTTVCCLVLLLVQIIVAIVLYIVYSTSSETPIDASDNMNDTFSIANLPTQPTASNETHVV